MLQLSLDSHPQILVPFESRFFIYLYHKYATKTRWRKRNLNHFYNDLFLDDRFRELWEVDKTHLKKIILSEPEDTSFARLYRLICLHHKVSKQEKDIKLIGDKNPVNCLFLPQINNVFPNAKFIHLIRDPRDVCLSQITNFSIEPLALAAQKWKLYNETIEKHKAKDSSKFFTLRYEDLVENPQQEIKKICAFLEVDFKETMIDKQKRNRDHSHIDANLNIEKEHGNVNKPISTKSIGKWQKGFTEQQTKKVEGITKTLMKAYKYKQVFPETQPASTKEKLHFQFKIMRLKAYYKSPISLRKFYRKLLGISSNFAGK